MDEFKQINKRTRILTNKQVNCGAAKPTSEHTKQSNKQVDLRTDKETNKQVNLRTDKQTTNRQAI